MSEVERFYPKLIGSITFLPDDDGEWVKASDYAALAAELARVKAESLRVVPVGNPVEYGQWWTKSGYGEAVRLSTGQICIEHSGDCVSEAGGAGDLIDIDDIEVVQPVRLERWEASDE